MDRNPDKKLNDTITEVADTAKAGMETVAESGTMALQSAQGKLRRAREEAQKRYHAMQDLASDCVTKHPGKSVATIAALSLAIGLMVGHGRGRSSRH